VCNQLALLLLLGDRAMVRHTAGLLAVGRTP